MDIINYLDPTDLNKFNENGKNNFVLGSLIEAYPNISEKKEPTFGLLGVVDNRILSNKGVEKSLDSIRKHLFQLNSRQNFPKIIDFGNIKKGFSLDDTEAALNIVINELAENNILPIIIGSKHFAYQAYKEFNKRLNYFNISSIEPELSLQINNDSSKTYLEKIVSERSKSLLKFSNIGYQSYYTSNKEIELYNKLKFDAYRLGFVRQNLLELEPILRDSDLTFIDIGVVKQADAPGNMFANPNGLYSEEICQLSRFIGMSNKLKVFGLFEVNPEFDFNDQTSKLSAQIIWHLIDGFANKKNDQPHPKKKEDFVSFIVNIDGVEQEIEFLKNKLSLRWWIKIPSHFFKTKENYYASCSHNDYLKACNNEIPNKLLGFI